MTNKLNFEFTSKFAIGLSFILLTTCVFWFYHQHKINNETTKKVPITPTLALTPLLQKLDNTLQIEKHTENKQPISSNKNPKQPSSGIQNAHPPQYVDSPEVSELEDEASSVGERLQFEFDMVKDPATGKIPKGVAEKALTAAVLSPKFDSPWSGGSSAALDIPGATITAKGPNNLGGRTRAIGIDVRNANIMLAGSVSSGMYRSTNGGTSWTRVAPSGQIHNVSCIAQDTRVGFQDTWYYGTGEGSGNSATLGSAYRGQGIWKSIDNGITWAPLAATSSVLETFDSPFDYCTRLVVDPTNGNVYGAVGTQIQRSTNGGLTWSVVLGSTLGSGLTDIIVTPSGRLYAAIPGTDANEGVYTSTTGASGNWMKIAGTISSIVTPATWNAASAYGRIVLAYAPSNTNMVYALYYRNVASSCTGTAAPEAELFSYDQNTTTWTDLSANLPDESGCLNGNDPFAVQGGYDLAIAVKPDDENTVFIAGTNVYRSTSGFTNTTTTKRIGGYNSAASYALYPNHHPDVHTLVFANGDNNTLFTGDDGGIQKADITQTNVTWTPLNNDYVTYQYYHVDLSPTNGSDVVVGGAQDNGTTLSASGTTFSSIFSGDGVAVGVISYTNASTFNILGGSQNGSLYRITTPNNGFNIKPTGSASIFVTYFHLDQDNTNHLFYAGNNVLYRTRIASTINATTLTANAATGWEQMTGTIAGNIRCMATTRNNGYAGSPYSASDASRKLYIGTESGNVYRLNNPAYTAANTTPTNITPVGATGLCSSIAINPTNDDEILVTYSNYNVISVYHTTNAGSDLPTWTNIEGAVNTAVQLASARSSAIVQVNGVKHYIIGTSVGLYSTNTLSGATTLWSQIGSTDINYALISHMRYRPSDNKIIVGTHGNGMFLLELPGIVVPLELLSFDGKGTQEGNQLKWLTAAERDLEGYEVQRSYTGEKNSFEKIGYIKAHNLTTRQTYDFVDADVSTTTPQYYRLKVVERTASKSSFTKIVTIEPAAKRASLDFVVAPNPVGDEMQIVFANAPLSNFTVNVMDITGRIVRTQTVKEFNSKSLMVTLSNLASGTYLARIQSPTGSYQTVKFFKQ